MGQLLLEDADRLDDVEILPRAGWARDDRHAAPPEAERFEHVVADLDLLDRIGGQRDADRVTDARPQQHAEPDRRLDRPAAQTAGLGDPEVQRIVAGFGELLIGGDGEKHVGGLARDLELEEIVVLEDLRMGERAFHHGFRAGLAVFLEQVALERAGIDADAHRAAMILGGLHDLLDPRGGADIAGIDAQAGSAALRRFDGALIMEVNIGDDRHLDLADDVLERQCRFLVRARDAHDIGAGLLKALDLLDRRLDVMGQRIGHRLHRDRRVAADRHLADMDLPTLATVNVPIRPDAHKLLANCFWG